MATSQDYRRYAAECLALAEEEQHAKEKAGFILMAASWRTLAERLENSITATAPLTIYFK